MVKKPVDYKQYDSKWRNTDYSAKGEVKTIKSSGCGITCSAMVIASLKDKSVTPVETAKWSKAHGYKYLNQGTAYGYFKPQFAEYGIKCEQLNGVNMYHNKAASIHKTVLSELLKGNWIIACMGVGRWTKGGHYVLCYAYENGYVYINDPASIMPNRLKAKIEDWQNEVKYYWKVEIPTENKLPKDKTAKKEVKETVKSTAPTAKVAYEYYVVESGDTLSKIAVEYKVSVDHIVKLNGIKKPDSLNIGQKLLIDTYPIYVVVSGDTLSKISSKLLKDSNRYKEIMDLNGLKTTTLSIGQELKIPNK